MPTRLHDRLEKVLAEGNRKWAISPAEGMRKALVCYCECDWEFVSPGDRPEQR